MSSEDRLYFEAALLKELKIVASKFDGVVATKNKLKFKHNKKNVAELFLDHIARVDSYVLAGVVSGGSFLSARQNSHLLTEVIYLMMGVFRSFRQVSKVNGLVEILGGL